MSAFSTASPSSRRWWLILAVIVLVAAALRLTGYTFSLPYIDHPDEPAFYLTGLEWRGLFDNQTYLTGYPPIYIWLNIAVQLVLEPLGIRTVAATIAVLRLLSIGFGLLTVIVIALAARRVAGELAGWVAGTAWALSPQAVEYGVFAAPDPLLYLLVALALWLAIEACYGRPHWSVWSVAAGALAILDKYYVLTAALPGMLVAGAVALRDRRRGLRYLGIQVVLLAVTGLTALVGILVLPREGATARESGLTNVLNAERVLNNIYYAIYPLQPAVFLGIVIAGIAAYLLARRYGLPRVRPEAVGLCLVLIITVPWLAASFSRVSATERMKDVLPATTAACVLLGIAIGQIVIAVPKRYGAVMKVATTAALMLMFVPQVAADVTLMQNRLLPDHRVALRQWADLNLEPGTVLVEQPNHKTFNPFWGGIEGQHWFDWWLSRDVLERTPQAWRDEHGISYAVIDWGAAQEMQTTEAGQAFLAPLLHLRDFRGDARSPQFSVYRLWGMEHGAQAQFGDSIRLLGYDQDRDAAAPGEAVTFRFYWQAAATPTDDYSLFIHLLAEDSDAPLAQADGAPARPERLTLSWNEPSETLISQPFALTVPPDAPPGSYRVMIGLYNYVTGQRLPVTDLTSGDSSGDALLLTRLEVSG